jgi:hypothetical protein
LNPFHPLKGIRFQPPSIGDCTARAEQTFRARFSASHGREMHCNLEKVYQQQLDAQ